MLVLTRKINEEIKIGSDITIKIITTSDNQVKIGFEAPKNIQILRGEVYEKIKESTIEASKAITNSNFDLNKYKLNKKV
ncbi:MAG: carbon storage regulator CsrA [Stygiobacter sp.]|jgi:carbon storage regulator|uniref:Translational regulator CsrA n=1 Tax=Stygiobacter electus TaxID=3032292 RepID=A0AAE3NYZ0_9BACT|nr:carbon storage regulator CsrA [Stygiobacter electus]MDF1611224.1 carbon storage regulator CsrA [Stygiobacter electus]